MSAFYIRYPSSSGAGSNPSNGTNGATAPSISTQVGGVGVDGNLHPLVTDNTGVLSVNVLTAPTPAGGATSANQTNGAQKTQVVDGSGNIQPAGDTNARSIKVDASATTQPISAASLPLPTGAATSALQTTGNTSLSTIATNTPAVGQALMAASSPVVIASNQSAIPASQSGTWNITNVSGTVSLPTGAATETTLSAINGKLPAQGQALAANSQPVVLTVLQEAALKTNQNGTLTDRSGTCSATPLTATTLAASNAARKYLFIENNSTAGDIYINFTTSATATNSVVLKPFATYEMSGSFVSTELISVASNAASATFSAKEG